MDAKVHLWEYYTDVAKRRGKQGRRNSGNSARLALRKSGRAASG